MSMIVAAESSAVSDIGIGTAFVVGLLVGIAIVLRVVKAVRAEFGGKPSEPSDKP